METQLLATFVTVARLGSFSAAAAELGYTQAAISQQVAALEADLKAQLLTRRPVAPTEAGSRLLEHAGPLLLLLESARAEVARLTQEPAAALTLGVTPLAASAWAAGPALARLRRHAPRLQVTVRAGDAGDIAQAVARGDADLGLVDGLAAPGDSLALPAPLAARGVTETPVAVAFPAGHPLAGRPGIALAALADARWIDAPGAALPLTELRRAAESDGFRPALRYEGTDTATLKALAVAGHGLTLLPLPPAPLPGLACVPVTVPPLVLRVELIGGPFREGSPAAALAGLLASPA